MELLLFYSIPRHNTNELAHALLSRFGSLDAVLSADVSALMQVDGIGEHSALHLRAVASVMARCEQSRADERRLLSSYEELERYLLSLFIGSAREKTFLLLFNAASRLVSCELLGEGDATRTPLCARRVVELSLHKNAAAALLAHNHADGLVLPSEEDEQATARIAEALEAVGVRFVAHYIVTPDRCVAIARKEK